MYLSNFAFASNCYANGKLPLPIEHWPLTYYLFVVIDFGLAATERKPYHWLDPDLGQS